VSSAHPETDLRHPGSPPVTAVVLAGGLGRRMGNVDKGLELLEGRPLIGWVLQLIAPQVEEVLVNANRNREAYETFGYRVIEDRIRGYVGPLAGLHSALSECRHALMICVPCDTPFLPDDLVARLAVPLNDEGVDLTVALTGTQSHPVICLTRKRVLPHLAAYLEGGGRKVDAWYASLRVVEVAFDDRPQDFRNINTSEELRMLERTSRS
jgi:molybdopterin-guanine dinucleotide biosynthesis protein A